MRTVSIVILSTLAVLSYSAPAPAPPPLERKEFPDHVEDFIGLILAESGVELEQLFRRYGEERDFGIAMNYFRTANFTELFREVESLPEFQDVVHYLESANINVTRILEWIDDIVEHNERMRLKPSKNKDGETVFTPFIREMIHLFPKEKLVALYVEKQKESQEFRDTVEKLKSKEWERLFQALWNNEEFKKAVNTLAENGLDLRLLFEQIKSTFGHN